MAFSLLANRQASSSVVCQATKKKAPAQVGRVVVRTS